MALIKCNCTHEYQDRKYGKNIRVGNECIVTRDGKYRCTVCGKKTDDVIQKWLHGFIQF